MNTVIKISKNHLAYWGQFHNPPTWTHISDVGKIFRGKRLTLERYLLVERKYVQVLDRFFKLLKIRKMKVTDIELPSLDDRIDIMEKTPNGTYPILGIKVSDMLSNGIEYPTSLIKVLFVLALRESFWARFSDEMGNFIHVGYDLYFYIGSKDETLSTINIPTGLNYQFLEKSPYDPSLCEDE